MPVATSRIIRICLSLTAVCFLGGVALVAGVFVMPPQTVLAVRDTVMYWFGLLMFGVGASHVLIGQMLPRDSALKEVKAEARSHGPSGVMRACRAFMIFGVAAFFTSIAVVEANHVNRAVGEVAILGTFAIAFSSVVFGELWSTLSRIERDA